MTNEKDEKPTLRQSVCGCIIQDFCTGSHSMARQFARINDGRRVIRVRIVPVVAKAKRRKGAK